MPRRPHRDVAQDRLDAIAQLDDLVDWAEEIGCDRDVLAPRVHAHHEARARVALGDRYAERIDEDTPDDVLEVLTHHRANAEQVVRGGLRDEIDDLLYVHRGDEDAVRAEVRAAVAAHRRGRSV